ncbi:MAG: nitroreductase [Chloroflexota bacterium]
MDAIRSRRSISKFLPEPVPIADLKQVLAAGTWAPNHHLNEPWRFIIIGPHVRQRLAERYADLRVERIPVEAVDRRLRVREENIRKFTGIPVIVAVATMQKGDEQQRREDYAATCCAMQNIQLAAWAEGIGMKWSTNAITRDLLAYELLELDPQRFYIIGFLYAGFPADVPIRERKLPLDEVIRSTP